MNNGICPIHLLYQGQILEENLFAAFVRALFSFSKDMSEGEKSISSMTLGDMDIHYLAQSEEKYFVAISAEVGINQKEIDLYLKFISDLFFLYYPDYIEKLPPFEPVSFATFKEVIDFYITYTENKILIELEGITDIDLKTEINSLKFSNDIIVIWNKDENFIKLLKKDDLAVSGGYYPINGEIKGYCIQKNNGFIAILSNMNSLTIAPLEISEIFKTVSSIQTEELIEWFEFHPTKAILYYGSKSSINEFDISKEESKNYPISVQISDVKVQNDRNLILLDENNKIYTTPLPIKSPADLIPSPINEKVYSIKQGPQNTSIILCVNQLVYLWDTEEKLLTLKERYPNNTNISYNNKNNLLFLITDYNEFLMYDTQDASLLVNYNLVESGLGVFVQKNEKIAIVYVNGKIKLFGGSIDRDFISQLRNVITKRVETVENHIMRIHSGFQKIMANLENNYLPSHSLKNDLNQIKVFKQQLKRLIDDKLIERTSILRDLYFRLLGYQNQIISLQKLINDFEIQIEKSIKNSKEIELSGKTPRERIEDFLNNMKPREQIGLGSLADNIQLPYEECLNHLKTLESRGLLPGFLTRGSALSIKDNVIFVKKDPKFEESGITSF
jgi:hypothetical protein